MRHLLAATRADAGGVNLDLGLARDDLTAADTALTRVARDHGEPTSGRWGRQEGRCDQHPPWASGAHEMERTTPAGTCPPGAAEQGATAPREGLQPAASGWAQEQGEACWESEPGSVQAEAEAQELQRPQEAAEEGVLDVRASPHALRRWPSAEGQSPRGDPHERLAAPASSRGARSTGLLPLPR